MDDDRVKEGTPKLPPIFIPCINNIIKMLTNLKNVVNVE